MSLIFFIPNKNRLIYNPIRFYQSIQPDPNNIWPKPLKKKKLKGILNYFLVPTKYIKHKLPERTERQSQSAKPIGWNTISQIVNKSLNYKRQNNSFFLFSLQFSYLILKAYESQFTSPIKLQHRTSPQRHDNMTWEWDMTIHNH